MQQLSHFQGQYDVGIISKQWTLSSVGTKWRGYKCELKSAYYLIRDTDAKRLANPPPEVMKYHWEFLVKHWGTAKANEDSEKNKERCGKQTMLHTTGTKSFAHVPANVSRRFGNINYFNSYVVE